VSRADRCPYRPDEVTLGETVQKKIALVSTRMRRRRSSDVVLRAGLHTVARMLNFVDCKGCVKPYLL
jgi:hypothetical protein